MKKNHMSIALASSIVLSIALLSGPQANAGVFSTLKSISHTAIKHVVKVASNPKVQKAAKGFGMAAVGALTAKKAEKKVAAPMSAE